MLLGVPNFSEGRDARLVSRVSDQFARGATLLDTHSDPVHNRTVLTLAARPRALGESLARGAGACFISIDMRRHDGAHPCVGALDVCPLVFTGDADREAARAEALGVAEVIATEGVPVFLYGELASEPERFERSHFRAGGLARLHERMAAGELSPDFGPSKPHPSAGATLVTARSPLAAFNLILEGADLTTGTELAARLRESGGGLPGVRAIAVDLGEAGVQISTNIHDPIAVPLVKVVERVRELAAPTGARPGAAEVVGLVPAAAMEGFPEDVAIPGFEPERHLIETAVKATDAR